MKKMFTRFLALGIFLLAMQACNKDEAEEYYVSLATVSEVLQVPNPSYYFLLDSGTGLNPSMGEADRFATKLGKRYFIWYTIDGENSHHSPKKGYDISLMHYESVLTKDTIKLTAKNADSIGNDAVRIRKIWSGGGFLNISFEYWAGGNVTHYINLVENTLITPPADGKKHLELRHNANKSAQSVFARGFVCFNIKPYKVDDKKEVTFTIKAKGLDGTEQSLNVTYNYDTNAVTADEAVREMVKEGSDDVFN